MFADIVASGDDVMGIAQARSLVVLASLAISGASLMFFILAPVLGLPLSFEQGWQLAQINLPVFLGYMGAATQFIFRTPRPVVRQPQGSSALFMIVLIGPIAIYVLAVIAALVAFTLSNQPSSELGSGMSVDILSAVMTGVLSFLSATTNVAVSYLFAQEQKS